MVKSDDTLSSIAESFYGDDEYWTTIWNDNPFLIDENVITEGMKLKIRTEKPLLIQQPKEHASSDITPTPTFVETLDPLSLTPSSSDAISDASPTPPFVPSYTGGPLTDEQLDFLGNCESGMTATRNSGNGFYGAFQFMEGTWNRLETGYARADLAPLDVQKAAVQKLLSHSSIFNQFPGCARRMQQSGLI